MISRLGEILGYRPAQSLMNLCDSFLCSMPQFPSLSNRHLELDLEGTLFISPFNKHVLRAYYVPSSMKTWEIPDNVYDVGQYSVVFTQM